MMVNVERTGRRDTFPSRLRRNFGNDGCYHMDIDMVEYHYPNGDIGVKAFTEYKRAGARASKSQRELLVYLAQRLESKALIIFYRVGDTIEQSSFVVEELYPGNCKYDFGYEEFQKYIRAL